MYFVPVRWDWILCSVAADGVRCDDPQRRGLRRHQHSVHEDRCHGDGHQPRDIVTPAQDGCLHTGTVHFTHQRHLQPAADFSLSCFHTIRVTSSVINIKWFADIKSLIYITSADSNKSLTSCQNQPIQHQSLLFNGFTESSHNFVSLPSVNLL